MKTYAICNSPQAFALKLAAYYEHKGTRLKEYAETACRLKREKEANLQRAALLLDLAKELREEIIIQNSFESGKVPLSATFI